jgi:threonine/homoserine/homoserine lactone efflux protein
MTSLLAVFFTSLVVAFSGAMMPGPLLTITISESTQRGPIAGPLLIVGHAVLELVLLVGLLFGLGPLLKNESFFITIAFIGGLIMLWMAYGMFRALPTLSVKADKTKLKRRNLLLTGAIMSLVNPYWIIWWATIGIGYIVLSQKLGFWGIALFYLGHITGDMIWYVTISTAVGNGKKLFTDRIYRSLIAICGSFLVGFAFYLVISGITKLMANP